MQTKYEIGDTVWFATCNQEETSVECPDCGGTGRLRVTFHDETTVSIGCRNCSVAFDSPTGRIKVYNRTPKAKPFTILGLEIEASGEVRYAGPNGYRIKESCLFATIDEAMMAAVEMAKIQDQAERDRIQTKEKDTRSWAWNVTYHRREIKRAEKDIVHHTAKLAHAALKAKPVKAK